MTVHKRAMTICGLLIAGMLVTEWAAIAQVQVRAQRGARGSDGPGEDVEDAAAFLTDRETLRKMTRAEELLTEQRFSEAVLYLGSILDGGEDYFYRPQQDSTNYRSVKVRALELIGSMPEEGRAAYELQYGADAKRLLDEATSTGSAAKLEEVARRFFHTQAGYESMHRLAMHHLDHDRPLAAALCLQRLRAASDHAARFEPMLSFKLAICLARVGSSETMDEAVKTLRRMKQQYPDAELTLGGKRLAIPAAADLSMQWLQTTLGPQVKPTATSSEEWVMYRGNVSRNAPSVGGAPLLNARWRVKHASDEDILLVRDLQANHVQSNITALPGLHPLAVRLDLRESSALQIGAIRNASWPQLVATLKESADADPPVAASRIWSLLSEPLRKQFLDLPAGASPERGLRQRFVDEMNALFDRRDFYEPELWKDVDLRIEAAQLLRSGVDKLSDDEVFRLNRVLFEAVFRREVLRSFCDCVLMRTYDNLLAIDFVTGKRMWEIPIKDDENPFKRLMHRDNRANAQVATAVGQRVWNDATFGTLSSDGRLVFSVEGLGMWMNVQGNPRAAMMVVNRNIPDPIGPKEFNSLAAYDIRTGKLIWQVGGPKGSSEDKLSGLYFLGPPLPLAGQLYVLAEANSEVRLVVLEARTGELVWSQNLAEAQQGILGDPYRPLSGVSPSYADGVLVCPTSAGAIVAVDLTSRSLLWGYRYGTQPRSNQQMVMMFGGGQMGYSSAAQQADRWTDALATIADGHVILTPLESDEIHCLRLIDGSLVWKQKREDSLYVAAIKDGKVITVGSRQVLARELETGKVSWKSNMPDANSLPSGRGFLSENFYYLPLTSAEVVSIDITNGRVVARAKARNGNIPGNLICFKGTVISQGVEELESFDELTGLETQIVRDLERNPNDPSALARRGEILLQRGQIGPAVADFRKSLALQDDVRTRELLVESLLEGLRVDFKNNRSAVEETGTLISMLPPSTRVSMKARFLRTVALGLHTTGERSAAFETYLSFLDPEVGPPELERIEGPWSVRRDRWVQGRFAELFSQVDPQQRSVMDAKVDEFLQKALEANGTVELTRFVDHFGALPQGQVARAQLARRLSAAGDWLQAEMLLRQLERSPDPAVAHPATAQLAQVMLESGRIRDALFYYRKLAGSLAEVVVLDDKTGQDLINNLPADSEIRRELAQPSQWPAGVVKTDRNGGSGNKGWRYFPVELRGKLEPFYGPGSLQLDQQQRKFIGRDAFARQTWEASIAEDNNRFNHIGINPFANHAQTFGHLVVISTGQYVFAIDTLATANSGQAKVLWKHNLFQSMAGVQANAAVRFQFINRGGQQVLVPQDISGQPLGPVGPVTSEYCCFIRRRDLIVLDPVSGKEMWVRHDCPAGSDLFGDEEYLVVIAPGSDRAMVLRALDGQKIAEVQVPGESQRLDTFGRYVVAWVNKGNQETLRVIDVVAQKDVWTKSFATGSKATMVDSGDEIAVYEPSGKFTVCDVATGKTIVDAKLDADNQVSEVHVVRSSDRYVAIINRPFRGNNQQVFFTPINGGADNPIVNGTVYGFDRQSGEKLWATPVENQAFSLRQPSELPLLIFACRVQRRMGQVYSNECDLLCIDKRNGRIVYNQNIKNEQVNGIDIEGDPVAGTVDVKLTQSVVRLTMTSEPWPAQPAGGGKDAKDGKPADGKGADRGDKNAPPKDPGDETKEESDEDAQAKADDAETEVRRRVILEEARRKEVILKLGPKALPVPAKPE